MRHLRSGARFNKALIFSIIVQSQSCIFPMWPVVANRRPAPKYKSVIETIPWALFHQTESRLKPKCWKQKMYCSKNVPAISGTCLTFFDEQRGLVPLLGPKFQACRCYNAGFRPIWFHNFGLSLDLVWAQYCILNALAGFGASGLFYQHDQADQLKFSYISNTHKTCILPRHDWQFGSYLGNIAGFMGVWNI